MDIGGTGKASVAGAGRGTSEACSDTRTGSEWTTKAVRKQIAPARPTQPQDDSSEGQPLAGTAHPGHCGFDRIGQRGEMPHLPGAPGLGFAVEMELQTGVAQS